MAGFEVCTSVDEARSWLNEGVNVVLVWPVGAEPPLDGRGEGAPAAGGARQALWMGDPRDPRQRGWAAEMGAELFGDGRG